MVRIARRFPTTLAAALCAHAIAVFALASMRVPRASVVVLPTADEIDVVADDQTAELSPPMEPSSSDVANARVVRRSSSRPSAPLPSTESPATMVEPKGDGAMADDRGDVVVTRRAPIDLGIGGRWTGPLGSAVPSAAPSTEAPNLSHALDRMLRDELTAHDRALGISPGNALITVAKEAASPILAPDVGVATLEIESDASGRVVSASVVSGPADAAAWGDVAREIVKRMSGKNLRLPRGAHGLRTRLRISALRTLPSGKSGGTAAGAVPDDVPGTPGGDRACEGTGGSRKCVGGMPTGATATGADLSNIGARAMRVVRVQLLDDIAL